MPIPSKTPSATVEPDQSIDEILGLQVPRNTTAYDFCIWCFISNNACPLTQGEIHMSDDAIHDILEQTESDPAFQALFDLFDCSE